MSEYIERQVEVWEDHVRVGSIGNLWVSNAVKYLRILLDENTALEQRIEKLRGAMKKGLEEYHAGFGGEADMYQTIKKALDENN